MIEEAKVTTALSLLRTRADYEYFFGRLNSPDWIEPLRKKQYFRHPEPIQRTGDLIRVPTWPESQYLTRMAPRAPSLVMDVILAIPDTTNPRILEDYITAALAMPPQVSAQLAPRVRRWAPEAQGLLFPERLADLALHLASGGEDDAAIVVVQKLLSFDSENGGGAEWDFTEALKRLVEKCPRSLQMTLHRVLCDALGGVLRREPGSKPPVDHSYIWRPAIEDHQQNLMSGRRDYLVSAIRDLSERLIANDAVVLGEVVGHLESRRWEVFRRLALHAIRVAGPSGEALAKERLLGDRNARLHHEYVLLLSQWFPRMTESEREAILSEIRDALRIEEWRERATQHLGHLPTQEEEQRRVATYYVQRLTPIAEFLPTAWKTQFDEWLAIVGPAEHPEFLSYHRAMWVGPTSPLTDEEVRRMEVTALINYLRTWDPPIGHQRPTPDGLGLVLSADVQRDPVRFAAVATSFQGLHPTYVRSLLSGLEQALKQGRAFPWREVFALCEWVLEQADSGDTPNTNDVDMDPSWAWTRTEIARLLAEGFETTGDGAVPFDLRETAWRILAGLTDDTDPKLEDEEREGSARDAVTTSINSTRGVAMNTLIRYVIWVWRQKKDDATPWTFDRVPEVREVLDRHLDPAIEPTMAIRSIYGFWLPNLVALDRSWVESRLNRIFPEDPAGARLRDAAWDAYIGFSHPFNDVFELLRGEYRAAVMTLSPTDPQSTSLGDRRLHLAQHLMSFYWRGKAPIEDPDGLVPLFFYRGSDALRGEALDFIGRSLREEGVEVPKEVLDRLQVLWEWRIGTAEAHSATGFREELSSFGGWYASGRFDPAWAIAQLLRAVRISRKAEPDHWVIERLQSDCKAFPALVVECLALLIEGDTDGWRVMSWREEIRDIVGSVLKGNSEAAHAAAVDVVHRLGARGYFDFRDLLEKRGA